NRKIGYLARVRRQCLSPMLYIGFEPFPSPRTSYLNFTSIALFRGTLMLAFLDIDKNFDLKKNRDLNKHNKTPT
ncbi:MAG: hypothetical protein IJS61_02965, partial [Firmicutes bacterium]|nr:hypothetical protein [Bacillota bacterium]